MTGTHKVNTNVRNFTYESWVTEKLDQHSAKKLINNEINKPPVYKSTLMSYTSRRRMAGKSDAQSALFSQGDTKSQEEK